MSDVTPTVGWAVLAALSLTTMTLVAECRDEEGSRAREESVDVERPPAGWTHAVLRDGRIVACTGPDCPQVRVEMCREEPHYMTGG